jgi:hypothetical protein
MPQVYIPCEGLADNRLTVQSHRLNESRLWIAVKGLSQKAREELLTMSWEELFELASMDEKIRKTLPANDIAFSHFTMSEYNMLKLAELLEIRDQYKHLLVSS